MNRICSKINIISRYLKKNCWADSNKTGDIFKIQTRANRNVGVNLEI